MHFFKKPFFVLCLLLAFFSVGQTVFAAGNISSTQKFSQSLNHNSDNDGFNDFFNWSPTQGGATVTDTAITGYIWGEGNGGSWINLNPTNAPSAPAECNNNVGVKNTCSGILSGCAWGENMGWINFAPTNATGINQPKINTTTGQITGMVWSQNADWIQLSSPTAPSAYPSYNPSLGLVTSWHGCTSSISGCTNPAASNYNSSATIDDGSCIINTCQGPGCTTGGGRTLYIIKNVVGSFTPASNFRIHVSGDAGELSSSPQFGMSGPIGASYGLPETGTKFLVSEDPAPGYVITYGGDCGLNGARRDQVFFPPGINTRTCIVTNTYTGSPFDYCANRPGIQTSVPSGYYQVERTPGVYDCFPIINPPADFCSNIPGIQRSVPANHYQVMTSPGVYECYPIIDPPMLGCTDPTANNFNPSAIIDDDSCRFGPIEVDGCTDSAALNFNPRATRDNGSCEFDTSGDVYGCMDPLALNYDRLATKSNDSCRYPPEPPVIPLDSPIAEFFGLNTPRNNWWWPLLAVVGLLSSLPALISRFGSIILTLVFKRKRQRGIVYDAKTKEPLDPAYVSVIDVATGKEVTTQITDMEGRYGFILKNGSYRIVVSKTNYAFPSKKLAGQISDEVYNSLYFGEVFTVTNKEQVIDMNIPMDPVGVDWNQQEKRRINFLKYLVHNQKVVSWFLNMLFVIGFIVSVVVTYYYPVWWNVLMVVLYVIIAITEVMGYSAVTIGKITKHGVPLPYALIKVYNANLNREVTRKVTTEYGSYYILVPKANYYITVEERNLDGTYTHVFTSDVVHAGQGIINKPFKI